MKSKRWLFSNIVQNIFGKGRFRVIAILGMHRSGTSCLTGLMEDAGIYLGDVSKQNPHNLKGNQENLRIMNLHDAVLADNDASWDNPPQQSARWSLERKQELKNIIKDYEEQKLWAFKDPRTLFSLDGWIEEIPSISFIGTFRHPLAVANSLYNRGEMPQKKAFDLWCRYNQKLLEYQKKFRFDIVNFNLAPDEYLPSVSNALKRLGISHSATNFQFFDSSLRHAKIDSSVDLPAEAERIYKTLVEISL